jgi:hypothetical protein
VDMSEDFWEKYERLAAQYESNSRLSFDDLCFDGSASVSFVPVAAHRPSPPGKSRIERSRIEIAFEDPPTGESPAPKTSENTNLPAPKTSRAKKITFVNNIVNTNMNVPNDSVRIHRIRIEIVEALALASSLSNSLTEHQLQLARTPVRDLVNKLKNLAVQYRENQIVKQGIVDLEKCLDGMQSRHMFIGQGGRQNCQWHLESNANQRNCGMNNSCAFGANTEQMCFLDAALSHNKSLFGAP